MYKLLSTDLSLQEVLLLKWSYIIILVSEIVALEISNISRFEETRKLLATNTPLSIQKIKKIQSYDVKLR